MDASVVASADVTATAVDAPGRERATLPDIGVATSTYAPGQSQLSLSVQQCIDALRRQPFVARSPLAMAAAQSGDPARYCFAAPGLSHEARTLCFAEASAYRTVTTTMEASTMLHMMLAGTRDEARRAAIRECLDGLHERRGRDPEALPAEPRVVASRER